MIIEHRGVRSPCIRRPRRARGGRARRWCPSACSPPVETLSCPPSMSRTTSEQVASKLMPTMSSGATPAFSRARRAPHAQTADQISSESCSAWSAFGRCMAIGCSARPSIVPVAVDNAGARAAGADIDGADRCRHAAVAPGAREQFRQLAHVGEDAVRAERVASSRAQAGVAGMGAAGEGEDAHAGAVRGVDAGRAVLDDDAIAPAPRPSRAPHAETGPGAGLPRVTMVALYRCGSSISSRPVRPSDSRMRSRLPDEATQHGTPSRRQHFGDARHRLQLLAESAHEFGAHRGQLRVGEREPESRGRASRARGHALPRKCSVGRLLADVPPAGRSCRAARASTAARCRPARRRSRK